MAIEKDEILRVLDDASRAFTFPCLDNGYVYLAATRLSLFRSEADWAMVFEVFGYSPRAGLPDTTISTFASRLHDLDFRSIHPIEAGPWMDESDPEMVAATGELRLREQAMPLPPKAAYGMRGIQLSGKRPAVFELCRLLAAEYRPSVLATEEEQRVSVLPEMTRILQLDEWHHPDITGSELPSATETFRQLADVLVTGDPSRYRATEDPNTHWKFWPEGGTL